MEQVTLYHDVIRNIIHISRMHKRIMDETIQQLGIHHSQHFLLMFLSRHPEMPSQRTIANEMDISPAAVAMTIKKLECGGYVQKSVDQTDGRYHEIGLTEKGRVVVEQSKNMFREKEKEIFFGIAE